MRLDNLLVTPPRPRNPILADAFKRAGIVERTARGIDTIFFDQLRNGRPAPSYARSSEASVVITLPRGKANLDFVRLVVEESRDRILTLDELLVLNAMQQERSLSTSDAVTLIQKPEPEARAVLARLGETGLLEPRGEKRGREWLMSAAMYRRLGEESAYVRQRGFEPIQQEQMVLQFVEAHGRIKTGDIEDLCQLSRSQAYRLLQRLVEGGRLVRQGIGRGTYYTRGEE